MKLWGNDDPLFPATSMVVGPDSRFAPSGLKREQWSSAAPIRTIFRNAFTAAGLPYFHPHSFRSGEEVVIDLGAPESGVTVRTVRGMRRARVHAAVVIVEDHADMLRAKWEEYHA